MKIKFKFFKNLLKLNKNINLKKYLFKFELEV